ncbi:MAG: cardiolipin synthase [Holophagales bacterium]|jgi:cardiolipin synthase|nr:cardiolipin synthase [Holophagales bacterium]
MTFTEILALAALALDAVALVHAVTRHLGVASTLAWIFFILFLPGVGPLTYFLLASPRIRTTRRRRRLAGQAVRAAIQRSLGSEPLPAEVNHASPLARSVLFLGMRLTGLPPRAGNRVELLLDNERAFDSKTEAIRGAQRSVWAEYYIVEDDETGRAFLAELAERARAGCDVRLLYDAVGSSGIPEESLEALRTAGGKAEAFLPVNPLRRRWSAHLRNHRKLLVVDERIGFTGGMNVGDEYARGAWILSGAGRRHRNRPWRDAHLRVTGPAVFDLATVFAEDWTFASGERLVPSSVPLPVPGGSAVAVLPSGPDQVANANAHTYFAALSGALERCWLTTPYFVPDEPTVHALCNAAYRGLDVRVLVPAESDVPVAQAAGRFFYGPLLRSGVRIFEYLPGFLHAKTVVVDGSWALVGSANLDFRSFSLNFELGALVFDRAFATLLEERFTRDLAQSREVSLASVERRGFAERARLGLARLLAPLL